MTDCKYMVEGKCGSRLALPLYGERPSPGVCAQCKFKYGVRGLGDLVALAISYTPFRRMQGKCEPCKGRQEAMNSIAPARCRCKGRDGLNAPGSGVDRPTESNDATDI